MAVSIPSDLVADVMRAAEPSRVRSAAAKLARFGVPSAIAGDFSTEMARYDRSAAAPVVRAGQAPDAYAKFESFMLRDAFDAMLPDAGSGAYGEGFAGGVWRSMAAEQYASIFTAHGGLGVAEMLRQRAGAGPEAAPPAPAMAPDGQWPYFKAPALAAFSRQA